MRRVLSCLLAVGLLAVGGAAQARNYFGAEVGYAAPLGSTSDFASDGTMLELHWRHQNRGRTAYQLELGFMQMGLEGSIQSTISSYEALQRHKNELAQFQGGPGDGYLTASFGSLDITYVSASLIVSPWKANRVSPFISFGAGAYDWRVPFSLRFYRTPFFGEQHVYDPPAEGGLYAGVVGEEGIDFTKHETSGGLNAGLGATVHLASQFDFEATARAHLLFTSGTGNREEGVDDQPYLDNMKILFVKVGLNYRF